jgi:hypothetical protein
MWYVHRCAWMIGSARVASMLDIVQTLSNTNLFLLAFSALAVVGTDAKAPLLSRLCPD